MFLIIEINAFALGRAIYIILLTLMCYPIDFNKTRALWLGLGGGGKFANPSLLIPLSPNTRARALKNHVMH